MSCKKVKKNTLTAIKRDLWGEKGTESVITAVLILPLEFIPRLFSWNSCCEGIYGFSKQSSAANFTKVGKIPFAFSF